METCSNMKFNTKLPEALVQYNPGCNKNETKVAQFEKTKSSVIS